MSCEGHRKKFLDWVVQAYNIAEFSAEDLEKIYQAAKAQANTTDAAQMTLAENQTRQLFAQMQAAGIKPPTHAQNGLPKPDSCFGYARLQRLLAPYAAAQARRRRVTPERLGLPTYEELVDLVDLDGYSISTGYRFDEDAQGLVNRAGREMHAYKRLIAPEEIDRRSGGKWFYLKEEDFEKGRILHSYLNINDDPEAATIFGLPMLDYFQPDAKGFYPDGRDEFGFDASGYDPDGISIYGLDKNGRAGDRDVNLNALAGHRRYLWVERLGYKRSKEFIVDIEGFSAEDGFAYGGPDPLSDWDRFGFNRLGFRNGRSWTGFDENGLDANGNPRPKKPWIDAWGYDRRDGLTEPDDQGRRYNLIGWLYDHATGECFNPKNPAQRMKHEGSWHYNGKLKKVVLVRSYVPSEAELQKRISNPAIRASEAGRTPYHGVYAVGTETHYAYAGWLNRKRRMNQAIVRALTSRERLQHEPEAAFFGTLLRCPKCGQFTGAKPHRCPHYDNREVMVQANGLVAALCHRRKDEELIESEKKALNWWKRYVLSAKMHIPSDYDLTIYHTDFLSSLDDIRSVYVLETPFNPSFDPFKDNGPDPGYNPETGLDEEGYDVLGYHYLTGRNRHGRTMEEEAQLAVGARLLKKSQFEGVSDTNATPARVIADAFSRVATSIAGAPRRVILEEMGGPRNGMFSTDMKGCIRAERYPLGKEANEAHNLLAMKAGVYHELGHEEDTPPEIWARVVRIARCEEEVQGLPKGAAAELTTIFNILEDGRMERAQVRRRRGVATILAADAKIQPRWDERVGEDVSVYHQVMGMMLYRSLPFFSVRQEVLEQASPKARQLFAEVTPLVDQAITGEAEDAFLASVEILRRLSIDPEFQADRKSPGSPGSGGHADGGTLIISATPNLPDVEPTGIAIPAPGEWRPGRKPGQGQTDDPQGKGKKPGTGTQDQDHTGRKPGQGQTDDPQGKGKKPGTGTQDQDRTGQPGRGRTNGQKGLRDNGVGVEGDGDTIAAEPDQDFFFGISEGVDANQVATSALTEALTSIQGQQKKLYGADYVGELLSRPSSALPDSITVRTKLLTGETIETTAYSRSHQKKGVRWRMPGVDSIEKLAPAEQRARETGRQLARRLSTIRAKIQQKRRFAQQGKLDRRRYKRAMAGAENVRTHQKIIDISSLAVSLQLDMSGSMAGEIQSGELFGAASVFTHALESLDAEYMVTAFGSETIIAKSLGDPEYPFSERVKLAANTLGGTSALEGLALGINGLSRSRATNKLHIMMTDGDVHDAQTTKTLIETARRKGIVPFGIYFGPEDAGHRTMEPLFGAGNWVAVQTLDDLPKVAAKRIEHIYRRLLATL